MTGETDKIIKKSRYLFIYDADSRSFDIIFDEFMRDFSEISDIYGKEQWISGNIVVDKNNMAGIVDGDKGIYIWGDPKKGGTLEDILIPLLQKDHAQLIEKSNDAVTNMFDWKIQDPVKEIAIAEKSKKQKAIITLAGQRKRPGSSMNVMIDQTGLITGNALNALPSVKEFADFISKFAEFKKLFGTI
ncbi:MAG: hypothetical protein HQL64_14250 [Magnetococcales bacterium]|nr:hypothetical protein [Magnetococcales bacterium]